MNGPVNDHDLTNTLNQRADDFARLGGHDLDLSQVVSRAGEIRRGRRMRASMMMAAVVVAVAVPVGIVALDRGTDQVQPTPSPTSSTDPTGTSTPNPTPTETPTPTVVQPNHDPITLGALKSGALPKFGIVSGGFYELPGKKVPLDGKAPWAVAAAGNGLMLTTSDGNGNMTVRYVDLGDGPTTRSWPIEGWVAVSTDGALAAFTQPDGTVTVVQDRGTRFYDLGKIPTGSGFNTVSVNGENCSGRSEADTCGVVVSSHGEQRQTWLIGPHVEPRVIYPELKSYVGGTIQGLTAGMVSISDSGSCSEVRDHDDKPLWKTCDYRFLEFSPDGKYLLASGAYGDGFGDGTLAVLDAESGDVVLDLKTSGGAAIPMMQWEDDSHVLAVVSDQKRWSVQRISLDGQREYAVQPEAGTEIAPFTFDSPFVLVTR